MIAYIPARGGSKRIPGKNIKPLGGKPIIIHTIETVKSLEFIDKVCVSTDDLEIQSIVKKYGAETGELRAPELADDFVDIITLLRKDVSRFAEGTDNLLLVLPTAALVQRKHYNEAFAIYQEYSPEVLMTAVEYPISPYWAMRQKPNGFWEPLYPEMIRIRSQDLPRTRADAGLFYMMKWRNIQRYKSLAVNRLLVYDIPSEVAVDVDTPSDWVRLESLYRKQNEGRK